MPKTGTSSNMLDVKIAITGCGFVADYYLITLQNYPKLKIAGVYDSDRHRAKSLAQHYVEELNLLLTTIKYENDRPKAN